MFDGFETRVIDVGDTTIYARRYGAGAPLLLLHGFPETHAMWHRVAPDLAKEFTVVCADLRGYGASGAPPSAPDHAAYSKRTMAHDMIAVMNALGFSRFSVAGHDRGGRVAYRMALDHPERVDRLAVLDIIPTRDALQRADARFVEAFWPWSLLAQPQPLPERLIAADPEAVVADALANWGSNPLSFPAEIRAAYIATLRNPERVHAICEEYRAALTIDVECDARDSAANRRIECPVLALWSKSSALDTWYGDEGGPLEIWRKWATTVTGRAILGGHFFPEENPRETTAELRAFFGARTKERPGSSFVESIERT